jgi:hypothetical protein
VFSSSDANGTTTETPTVKASVSSADLGTITEVGLVIARATVTENGSDSEFADPKVVYVLADSGQGTDALGRLILSVADLGLTADQRILAAVLSDQEAATGLDVAARTLDTLTLLPVIRTGQVDKMGSGFVKRQNTGRVL